jgi:hypothetical protein
MRSINHVQHPKPYVASQTATTNTLNHLFAAFPSSRQAKSGLILDHHVEPNF